MAEEECFKRLYADMINYMPIVSIQRKMKEDEELKFADSDNCTHIVFDQEEMTKRDFEIFSDDLFKYLYVRRLSITEYCSAVKRAPEDPISNFHPHIGMSVLFCSFCIQKHVFPEIIEDLEIHNLDSVATFFTRTVFSLLSRVDYNVFQKLRLLASVTLELYAFCYLRGSRDISYAAVMYSRALQHVFKDDFFNNGGWDAWKNSTLDDVKFYEENKCETPIPGTQKISVHGWLKRFDRWIGVFPFKTCSKTVSTSTSDESANRSGNVNKFHDVICLSSSEPEKMPEVSSVQTTADKIKCLFSKDCPSSKRFKTNCNSLILELITIITCKRDSASEDIFKIIENGTSVESLTRYCILMKLILLLRDARVKVTNADILQCMKLILQDSGNMAAQCFLILAYVNAELNNMKSSKQYVPEGKNIDATAENNRQETNSNIDSSKHLFPPKKESSFPLYQENKNLLDEFVLKIKTSDQRCTSAASAICEILSNKAKAEILLTFTAFKSLMKTTVDLSEYRWEDEWILSIMKRLINSQTNEFEHLPTADITEKTELLANQVSVVNINPQLTASVPCSVTETTQSSVPFISDREDTESEPDFDSYINTEVENLHQNVPSFKNCKQCFNWVKEKMKLFDYISIVSENSTPPEEETGVQKGSINSITRDTSVHEETLSTDKTSETTAIDLPLDLDMEITGKDIKQAHYSEFEINNPENEVENDKKRSNAQFGEYRDSKNEITFSQEDNSGTIHKTQPVDETNEVTPLSEISSV